MPGKPPPHGKRELVDEAWRDLSILLLVILVMMVVGAVATAVARACA